MLIPIDSDADVLFCAMVVTNKFVITYLLLIYKNTGMRYKLKKDFTKALNTKILKVVNYLGYKSGEIVLDEMSLSPLNFYRESIFKIRIIKERDY